MRTVLIPVDDTAATDTAIGSVVMRARHEPLAIHLLSVQMPFSAYVARFVGRGAIRNYHHEEGERQLSGSRQMLNAARLPYVAHCEIGEIGVTVGRRATELRADEIVLGSDGSPAGNALQWLRAAQIRRHATAPVVLVLPPRPTRPTVMGFRAPYAG